MTGEEYVLKRLDLLAQHVDALAQHIQAVSLRLDQHVQLPQHQVREPEPDPATLLGPEFVRLRLRQRLEAIARRNPDGVQALALLDALEANDGPVGASTAADVASAANGAPGAAGGGTNGH